VTFSHNNLVYPHTAKVEQSDNYHGVEIKDPYRWLENPDSESTIAWVKAQNEVTTSYLESITGRDKIQQRLTQLWNYEKYGSPFKRGQRYFYFKNDGLQNQSVLYTLDSLDGEGKVLLDPNKLSEDGTVALSGLSLSDDGNWMAYGLSTAGSDWVEYRVRNIATGEDNGDHLQWIKFSGVSWTNDHQGFFYSRYDEPNEQTKLEDVNYYQKLYYHRLGTKQAEDTLIYDRPDQKEWGFSGGVTEDGKYLIITVWLGTDSKNLVFYKNLSQPDSEVVELIGEFEASYGVIDHDQDVFWVQTDFNAPKGKVIAINLHNPEQQNWQEIIPEAPETLESVGLLNNQFVADYLQDARSQIKIYDLDGTFVREVELPGIGSAGGFGGKRHDTETFYIFTSFTTPATIYRYDMTTGVSTLFRQPQVDFDPEEYQTQQVFYTSKKKVLSWMAIIQHIYMPMVGLIFP